MDRVDEMLTAYFEVDRAPEGLASRIVARVRDAGRGLRDLLEEIQIAATDRGVNLIRAERLAPPASTRGRRLVEQAREELAEYLEGKRTFFSVPADLSAAAPFQRKVLEAVRRIPFGEVRSYQWIARRIGHPRAVRAVGTALGRNPVPLLVPCTGCSGATAARGGISSAPGSRTGCSPSSAALPCCRAARRPASSAASGASTAAA